MRRNLEKTMTPVQPQDKTAAAYTTETILTTLGYPDPLVAARQHARMILLGRQARYQAMMRRLEARWGCSLNELRARYLAPGREDFAADDDYVQWQWYADAAQAVEAPLTTVVCSVGPDR
jgi:hypothetical protein